MAACSKRKRKREKVRLKPMRERQRGGQLLAVVSLNYRIITIEACISICGLHSEASKCYGFSAGVLCRVIADCEHMSGDDAKKQKTPETEYYGVLHRYNDQCPDKLGKDCYIRMSYKYLTCDNYDFLCMFTDLGDRRMSKSIRY